MMRNVQNDDVAWDDKGEGRSGQSHPDDPEFLTKVVWETMWPCEIDNQGDEDTGVVR